MSLLFKIGKFVNEIRDSISLDETARREIMALEERVSQLEKLVEDLKKFKSLIGLRGKPWSA